MDFFEFPDSWEKNWVYSEHPGKEFGKFVLSHGKFFNDADNDKGAYLGNYILTFICTVD
jgi:calreticulin